MDLSSGPINPRIASILPVIWKYNGTQSTITELTLEPCKFDYHFPKETYAKVFAQLKLDDFQCIAKGERNLSLFFDNNNWSGQYIILYLRTSTNTTENGNYCFPQEKIDQHLSGSSIYLSYLIESMNIDHYNRTNPISPSSFFQQIKIGYYSRFDLNVYWKPVEYKTDRGWLFESLQTENLYQVDENMIKQTTTSTNEHYYYPNTFSKIQFGLHYSSMDRYKRTYPKVQSVVANISGLVQVSFQVAKLIVNLFTLGRYYSFFFESNTALIYNPLCSNSKKQLINTEIKYSSKPRLINQINRDKKIISTKI